MALDTLDPTEPLGSRDADDIDLFIRETRQAIIDSFGLEHDLIGGHKALFLSTAMLQDDAVTKDKINNDIANALKGIKRDATTKQLEVLIDTNLFEFNVSGELTIKAGADLGPFLGLNSINGDRILDLTLSYTKLLSALGAPGDLLIQQAGGGYLPKTLKGLIIDSDGNVTVDVSTLELIQYARVEETNGAAGTPGGTLTGGTWNDRNMNVVVADNSIVSGATTLTVKAGDYIVLAELPAYGVGRHKGRIFDVTGAAPVVGGQGTSSVSIYDQTNSRIVKFLSLAVNTDIKFQTWAEVTKATNGKGVPTNLSPEVYASAIFLKVA